MELTAPGEQLAVTLEGRLKRVNQRWFRTAEHRLRRKAMTECGLLQLCSQLG
jgi:hypothetical protein